jgi:hypothetical protein
MTDATQAVNNEVESTTSNQDETTAEVLQNVSPETPKEATVGETLVSQEVKKAVDSVPLSRLNKEIAKRKELEERLAEVEAQASQKTNAQVDADIDSIAEEFNLDPAALNKIAQVIKKQAESEIEEKLRPLTEREEMSRKEALFNQHFAKAMENLPELKDVVNPEVIKQLAFSPANGGKTFSQLILETYGHALKGRDTVETTVPRGGATGEVDYSRAKSDPAYFKEIMANPTLKQKYNDALLKEVSRF